MVIISPFLLMITLGLAKFPSFLVASPTPENQGRIRIMLTQRELQQSLGATLGPRGADGRW